MPTTRIVRFALASGLGVSAVVLAFQPDPTMLRHVYEEALAKRRAEYGVGDPHTAQAARDLGLFLQRSGNTIAARRALSETIALDEVALGRSAPQTLEDAASLAAVSSPSEAERLYRRAAESADAAVAGPALSSLAGLRKAAGDRAGAAAYLRRALEKAELVDGKDGTIVALILNSLALDVEAQQGIALLERALQIDRARLGEHDPNTILTEVNLSRLLLAAGRASDAADVARQALSNSEAAFGPGDARTLKAARDLAAIIKAAPARK